MFGKELRQSASAFARPTQGHPVSHETVARLLKEMEYSLQGNRKLEEGQNSPDRDAQFLCINKAVGRALSQGQPVISVDTKKKELIGNYSNSGRQWHAKGMSERVLDHDFPDPSVPRAYPYGIYDLGRNTGFVNIGTDHDTATFAAASIGSDEQSLRLRVQLLAFLLPPPMN